MSYQLLKEEQMTDLREKTPAFVFLAQLGLGAMMICGLLWYLPGSPYQHGGQFPLWFKAQFVAAVLILVSGLVGALVMPVAGAPYSRYRLILLLVMFPSGVLGYLIVCLWLLRQITLPYSLLNMAGYLVCIGAVVTYLYCIINAGRVYLLQARLEQSAK